MAVYNPEDVVVKFGDLEFKGYVDCDFVESEHEASVPLNTRGSRTYHDQGCWARPVICACVAKETLMQLRSGTWTTIRYARDAKRPLWIVLPNGTAVSDGDGW